MTQTFQPKYNPVTPTKEMNYVGAVEVFFDEFTSECSAETKDTYISYYNNRIFPLIKESLAIEEYTPSMIEELIDLIQQTYGHEDSTIKSRTVHLLLAPINSYYRTVGKYKNPFLDSALQFEKDCGGEDIQSRLLKIKKSFSVNEEIAVAQTLLSDPKTEDGVLVGLAVMFLSGSRNGEACGYDFKDLIEMNDHPGSFCLRMFKTTVKDSNELKAGGKTPNAPRIIPVPTALSDFLLERKLHIESQVVFPYKSGSGQMFETVEDFPIACRRNEYWNRCDVKDLSEAGKNLLREVVKLSSSDLGGINYLIEHEIGTQEDLGEREPTTYLFRRNMATHLYTLGFDQAQIQYYMGHMLEATSLERTDFVDETLLYHMWVLLQRHPINPPKNETIALKGDEKITLRNQNSASISLEAPDHSQRYRIGIKGREWNDPISLHFDGDVGYNAEVHISPCDDQLSTEINVTGAIREAFEKYQLN